MRDKKNGNSEGGTTETQPSSLCGGKRSEAAAIDLFSGIMGLGQIFMVVRGPHGPHCSSAPADHYHIFIIFFHYNPSTVSFPSLSASISLLKPIYLITPITNPNHHPFFSLITLVHCITTSLCYLPTTLNRHGASWHSSISRNSLLSPYHKKATLFILSVVMGFHV